MGFWQLYRIIRRRRWLILLGMVVCVAAVIVANMRSKPSFTGHTELIEAESTARDSLVLYPGMQQNMDVQLRLSNLSRLATTQRVLRNAAESLNDLGVQSDPEKILRSISVKPVRDTNIIGIDVTLPYPNDAKVAADVVAAEFKKAYWELNNASVRQTREFIEDQVEVTRKAMINAQDRLRDFKQANGIVLLNNESASAVERLTRAKNDYAQADAGLQVVTVRTRGLAKELSSLPEWQVVSTATQRDPQWERLKTQLVELETTKASMLNGTAGQARKGPKHPDVLQVDRAIEETKRNFAAATETYQSSKSEARNPIYDGLRDRYIASRVDEASSAAQTAAMAAVVNEIRGEMAVMPAQQAKIAELEAEVGAASQTYNLMRVKLDEAKIKEQQAKNEVGLRVVEPAYVYPVNQRKGLKVIVAFLLSPLLGILIALLLNYTDNTVRTSADAEKALALPVLSEVPRIRSHSLVRQKCPEIVRVAYQTLSSNMWIASQNENVNSVVVVSAVPDSGRSITASNLAASLAQEGARVVLVDADFRQPTQHLIMGVDNKVGLSNLLNGAAALEEVLVPTRLQGLLLVPSGPVPDNPVKLLRSDEMRDFVEQVRAVADFVIYDTSAGVAFSDAVLVSSMVGSAIFVQSAGTVARGSEKEFLARLDTVGVNVMGIVLNNIRREDSSGYFHFYRSYSGVTAPQLAGSKKS